MNGLSSRQQLILGLVVREHVASAAPVGSRRLVGGYGLDVSSATIRNEMAVLEQQGYLQHPHTSAGRIPTVQGYRYFVEHLMGESRLPNVDRRTIRHQFHQARWGQSEQWLHLGATVLSQGAGLTALVTPPTPARGRFRHVELLLHGSRCRLVIILDQGTVEQRDLALDYPLSTSASARISDQLNQLFLGQMASEVRQIGETLSGPAREVADRIAHTMATRDMRVPLGSAEPVEGQLFRDGLAAMLEQPEFADGEATRRLVELLNRPRLLRQILAESLTRDGVQVLVGGEGRWEALNDYGMVVARYGVDGYAFGALGLLGPVRMPYDRAVSTVRFVSELMSEIVRGLYE
jgi:heat-inducible transcriptional repressor